MTIKRGIFHIVGTIMFVSSLTLCRGAAAGERHIETAAPPLPAVAEEAAISAEIRLDADRVGAIAADTPATMQALTTALPGLRIEEGEDFTEDSPYRVFRAHRGNDLILTIVPGDRQRIHSVVVASPWVHNGLGSAIGSRFDDAYAKGDYARCEPGIEELSGMLLCPAPSAANVIYLFSGTRIGLDGELPLRSQVRDWTLSRIGWTPRTAN